MHQPSSNPNIPPGGGSSSSSNQPPENVYMHPHQQHSWVAQQNVPPSHHLPQQQQQLFQPMHAMMGAHQQPQQQDGTENEPNKRPPQQVDIRTHFYSQQQQEGVAGPSSAAQQQFHHQTFQIHPQAPRAMPFHHSKIVHPIPMEKRLNPPPLPPQMLSGFEGHSVETLCTLGKELVLELMTRMFSIVNVLKMDIKGENKKDFDNVRIQLYYSHLIFQALSEIRLRIDLKLHEKLEEGQTLRDARPSDEQLLKLLSDPTPLEEDPRKAELAQKFERNRETMIHLNCQLKKLDWEAINSETLASTLKKDPGGEWTDRK